MTEKLCIFLFTLVFSLAGYLFSKQVGMEPSGIVMAVGLVGAFLGDRVYQTFFQKNDRDDDPPATGGLVAV